MSSTTNSPTNVASYSATLNGTLNDLHGESSLDVYFEYGTDTSYGSTTPTQTISSVPTNFSADITELIAFTTYHYRAVSTDGANYWYGDDVSFFTTAFTYVEDKGSDFETGTLTDVDVVDGSLMLMQAYALDFDGTDDYVNCGTVNDLLSNLGEFTHSCWIKWSHNNSWSAIFGGKDLSGEPTHYLFINRDSSFGNSPGDIGFWMSDDSGNKLGVFVEGEGLNDGNWHHIVWRVNDPSGNDVECFVDNVTKTLSFGYSEGPSGFSGSIDQYIGARNKDGSIDSKSEVITNDWHIFFHAITNTEIDTLYNNKYEPLGDEIVFYPMNEGSGNTIYDKSGNNNNGTIYSAAWTALDVNSSGDRITSPIDISTLEAIQDSLVQWTSTEPTDTSITIESSISTDGGSSWDSWQTCTDGDPVPGLSDLSDLTDTYVRFKQSLSTTDNTTTPELEAFEFYAAEGESGTSVVVSDSSTITSNTNITTQSQITDNSAATDEVRIIHNVNDAGFGSDDQTINADVPLSDESSVDESFLISVQDLLIADTGVGTDSVYIVFKVTDEGSGSDTTNVYEEYDLTVSDVGNASDTLSNLFVQITVSDTAVATESFGIDVDLSLSDIAESEDQELFKKRVRDWLFKATDRLNIQRPMIAVADTGAGVDEAVLAQRLVTIEDFCSGADSILTTILIPVSDSAQGIDSFDTIINIYAYDTGQGTELVDGLFFAKVRECPIIDEVFLFYVNITPADTAQGNDSVVVQQYIDIVDSGTGTDHDPRGCGAVFEDVIVDDDVSINVQNTVQETATGSESALVHKTITVTDEGVGSDEINSRFLISEDCTGSDDFNTEQAAILIQDIIETFDDATQCFSGEEGDVMIKIENTQGVMRIATLIDFTRPSQYTHKIKDSCTGKDLVEA